MKMDLRKFKSFIDEQIMKILGQMEKPSQILDHLYLVGINTSILNSSSSLKWTEMI